VMRPSRRETRLSLPIAETGNPFVEGQTWTLSFDRKGEVAHLQTEGVVTHYRRRSDGLVEIRFEDEAERRIEAIPTTLLAPEAEWKNGFFSYLSLFRVAGMVAGYDAVGGPGSVELESIDLPALEAGRDRLRPEAAPWRG